MELILTQLEKAKAPWWAWVLAFIAGLLVAVLRLKATGHELQLDIAKHQQDKAATDALLAQNDLIKTCAYARIEAATQKISALDKAIEKVHADATTARARINAAKSFRDLQS